MFVRTLAAQAGRVNSKRVAIIASQWIIHYYTVAMLPLTSRNMNFDCFEYFIHFTHKLCKLSDKKIILSLLRLYEMFYFLSVFASTQ